MTRVTVGTLALALGVVVGSAGPARAGSEIPFVASGHRVHVSLEKTQGGLHVINVIPDGESNLGDWVGDIDLTTNGAHVEGTMVITFESGDTLNVSFEQKWTNKVGEWGGTIGEFTVTGGTGAFAGAGGGGALTAVYLDKRFTEVRIDFDGVIELP
jgi:hypothetical protein